MCKLCPLMLVALMIPIPVGAQLQAPPILELGTGIDDLVWVPVGPTPLEAFEWGGLRHSTPAPLVDSVGNWVVVLVHAHLDPNAQDTLGPSVAAQLYPCFYEQNSSWATHSASWSGNFSAASGAANAGVPIKVQPQAVSQVLHECVSLSGSTWTPSADAIKGYGQPVANLVQYYDVNWPWWTTENYPRRNGTSSNTFWTQGEDPRPANAESWAMHYSTVAWNALVAQYYDAYGQAGVDSFPRLASSLSGSVVSLTFQAVTLRSPGCPRQFTGPIASICGLDPILSQPPIPPDFRVSAPVTLTVRISRPFNAVPGGVRTMPIPPNPVHPVSPDGFVGARGTSMCVYLKPVVAEYLDVFVPRESGGWAHTIGLYTGIDIPPYSVFEFTLPMDAYPGVVYFGKPGGGPFIEPPAEYAFAGGEVLLVPIPVLEF